MAAAVENMDTSSPPASPAANEKNVTEDDSKKSESEDSSNHTNSEHSNGPVENNNEDSSHSVTDKDKRNGITPDDSQSQESNDSQPKTSVEKTKETSIKNAKQSLIGASDTESRAHTNEEDSGDDSNEDLDSSEEGSEDGSEGPAKAVSVNSDSEPETVEDDSSRDGQSETDVVMVENINEVHEIVSDDEDDDCVVTNEEKIASVNGSSITDNDSDIEETSEDPLNHSDVKISSKPKSLLKPIVSDQKDSKKDSSVLIIDTESILSGKGPIPLAPAKTKTTAQVPAQSLPESLRGSNLADITVKPVVQAQSGPIENTPQGGPIDNTPLLPTLTDDMFVVEAPSFIVPYVYEKPAVEQFRQFVDGLGKELEEKRTKEEKEQLEKEKEEKERRKKEREEKKAKGEEVEDSSDDEKEEPKKEEEKEINTLELLKQSKDEEKKRKGKKRKGENDEDDDQSWEGGSDMDSEEEAISEDDELTTVVLKDKDDDSIEDLKIATNVNDQAKPAGVKSESFFDNNLGKFFMNIGIGLVQEYVQTDLLKQQKRKLRKELKTTRPDTKTLELAINYLTKNVEGSRRENAPYKFRMKNCKFCYFKTESALVMEHHLETPHMKNNIYTCNFCPFEVRSPHDILFHMEAEHNTRSRLERAPAYHQCANCPFEDNGKGKLARHLIACAKKFKPDLNLAPPVDWEPPAKIPKLTRPRVNLMGSYNRPPGAAPLGRPPIISGTMPGMGRPRGPQPMIPRGNFVTGAPLIRGGVMMRQSNPQNNFPLSQNTPGGKIVHQPSISITPLPRTPQPAMSTPPARTQGSFVICEICDGYIKDLEQLRSHMQWIHKVKIHPKMIYNRPPLNCQKCQFRFFTDQGLERHLLGSHGLVTSSMQETANQGKDSGRCPVCGRVYQWKLLNHVAKDHNMTLKPAHLSYKCTVCTATFGMYKQFESHVYSMHSAVGKKMAENKPVPRMMGNSSITIVPTGKAK